ncbi:ABC transporter substrate-binding protein [Roseibium sp. SCP14]|uniref:ABC transporter substrate-binding protein n=1 Tax=Roseibium sp. SCP14 TaxID=3141375 RepID=UPI003337532C
MNTKGAGNWKLTRRAVLGHMAGAGSLLAMPSIVRASEKLGGELYFETFGGAYAEAVKTYIIDPFEERYGVKVRVTNFGSGGEQLAKVQASNDRIDVTSLNGSRIYAAIKNGSLLPLDLVQIPNFADQHPNFQKPAYEVGDGNNYSSALVWGDTAIAYNTDFVKEMPTSWDDFMRPEVKGRTALFSSAMSLVHLGALMTGQNINDIQDLAAVESKLMELKPQLLKFWSSGSENTQLFATGEIWLANFWRGRVNKLREEGHPIQYTVPKEGAVAWVDCMVIPKTCQNKQAAEAFINMTLDPEIQKNFVTEGITYAPSNVEVKLTPEEQQKLGASPEIFETAKFVDSAYVAANQDQWNLLANRVKAS